MRNRFEVFLILLIVVFAFSLAGAQSGAARGKGRIKGNLTDPSGKPLEGATVHFSAPSLGASFDLKTDANGDWAAGGIAGGQWNVDLRKEGYVTKKISVAVYEFKHNDDVKLALQPMVVQPSQKEIPGADLLKEAIRLKESQDYPGALAKYQEALTANPSLTDVYLDMGNIYTNQKDYDMAMEAYGKFMEKDTTNSVVHVYIANVWLQKGKPDEAQKVLSGVNLDTVTDSDALFNLGASFYNSGNVEQAIRYWEKASQLNPQSSDMHLQLGLAYYSAKQMDRAKAELQKVMELDPGSENAKSAKELLDTMH